MSRANTREISDARSVRERIRNDPVWFVNEMLGFPTWSKQEEILTSVRDYYCTAAITGHDVGKSMSGCFAAFWFLMAYRPSSVWVTAPTWRQIEEIFFGNFRKIAMESKTPIFAESSQRINKVSWEIEPKWGCYGINSNKMEKVSGYHNVNVLVVFDEASGIADESFDVIDTALANRDEFSMVRKLLLGNPTRPSGEFHRIHKEDEKGTLSEEYNVIYISSYDSPNVTGEKYIPGLAGKKWIEEREKVWGRSSPQFKVRVLGEFCVDIESNEVYSDNMFIVGHVIKDDPIFFGIDIARKGSDKCAVGVFTLQGLLDLISWGQCSITETKEILRDLWGKYLPALAALDMGNYGGAVYDDLTDEGYPIIGINFQGPPLLDRTDRFANARAEMHIMCAEDSARGEFIIGEPHFLESLKKGFRYITYSTGNNDKLLLSPKNRFRTSPDENDAVALANLARKLYLNDLADGLLSTITEDETFDENFYDKAFVSLGFAAAVKGSVLNG